MNALLAAPDAPSTAQQRDEAGRDDAAATPIIHFGDSHCLSFAYRSVRIAGAWRPILPRLCTGAKAHHFAAARPGEAKAVLARQFDALRREADGRLEAAALWFSFGEIDCRQSEGVLAHHRRSGQPLSEIIRATVEGYLAHVADLVAGADRPVFMFGVPAALRASDVAEADHAARLEVIRRFNETLASGAAERGFGFIDLWAVSAGAAGEADAAAFCDGVHLRPGMIAAIERQLCELPAPVSRCATDAE